MAQRNSGGQRGRRTTAVKDNEEKESGILPYVVTGLAGVAVGLLGSLLLDKAVETYQAQELAGEQSICKDENTCPVCQDEATPTFKTRCCGKLIHGQCLQDLRDNSFSRCPFCRSRGWLG